MAELRDGVVFFILELKKGGYLAGMGGERN